MDHFAITGIAFGAEAGILLAAIRWMWSRLTKQFEQAEVEMTELREKYDECLQDKQEFAQQVARFEERTDSMKSEIERMRAVLETSVAPRTTSRKKAT